MHILNIIRKFTYLIKTKTTVMETIYLNNENCKEYSTEDIMLHCGLTEADFDTNNKVEVNIKITGENERVIERKRNGIITDTCLIDFETEVYFGKEIHTVRTWYDVNEPYAYRSIESNKEFNSISEARKELRIRSLNWVKKFEKII